METTTRKTGNCSHRNCTDKVFDRVRSHHEQFADGGADHGDGREDKEQMRAASLPYPHEKMRQRHCRASSNQNRPDYCGPTHD